MRRKLVFWLCSGLFIAGNLFARSANENLTHSWNFNDGTVNDYIGGANGTVIGNATVTDGVLWIGAQDEWLELPGETIALNTYEAITIEAWFVPFAGINTGYTMLAFFGDTLGGVGVDSYFMTPARGDDISRAAITCGVYTNPWSGETGANGVELDDGELHHMVSTLTDEEITLYIDGDLAQATPMPVTNSISLISPNVVFLAKSGYLADPEWIGDINEFNIYNTALSDDDIYALFQQGPSEGSNAVESATAPSAYGLMQNYPNPFNPETNITFDLPEKSEVRIAVYDVLGQELAILTDGMTPAGRHTVRFDANELNSGVYLCRMQIGSSLFTRRMLLLK